MQNISIYPGAILELKNSLREKEPKKIFLVTGKESYKNSGASEKLSWLNKFYDVIHFYDFESNPSNFGVEKGLKIFNQEKCDLIISVGGGSPIDMAKLINYFHCHIFEALDKDNLENPAFKPKPHICIPTTAGSGSESTHFAVMYISNEKYSIAHEELVPEIAIIDPELHYSQTPYQKAVSGADALAQAIESLWSIQSTKESRSYSERALELVWKNLQLAVHKGDRLAHINLAFGANLAGRAINIAKTTAPHAFAYGFTKFTGLPHGHAVALLLPFFIHSLNKMNSSNCTDPRGELHVNLQLQKIAKILNTDVNRISNKVYGYLMKLGIDLNIKNLSISPEIFSSLFKNVNVERLTNFPTQIELDSIQGQIVSYNEQNNLHFQ